MIKFFRHIRRSLIQENKMGKYFKYAIGEILLVVIGILIALSINNWNDSRKTRAYEQEILTLINQNLKLDSIALSIELKNSREAIALTNRVIEEVSSKTYSDSLHIWLAKIISFERFKSKSSAFEVLKAKGIETISDSKLQLELITYYDEKIFFVEAVFMDVEESFKNDWVPIMKEEIEEFVWRESVTPINIKAFFEKKSNVAQLKLYQGNRASSQPYIEEALEKLSQIRTLSRKYIDD